MNIRLSDESTADLGLQRARKSRCDRSLFANCIHSESNACRHAGLSFLFVTPAQSELIVRTKLRMPRPARSPVARERLLTRLGGRLSPVTIVSAPPGSGKTTLVAQLVGLRRDAVAWFQIDRPDSDPRRFVAHLIAARCRKCRVRGSGLRICLRALRF